MRIGRGRAICNCVVIVTRYPVTDVPSRMRRRIDLMCRQQSRAGWSRKLGVNRIKSSQESKRSMSNFAYDSKLDFRSTDVDNALY
jgi:hypothetical protein